MCARAPNSRSVSAQLAAIVGVAPRSPPRPSPARSTHSGGVRIVHRVVVEVPLGFQDMVNDRSQENDIGARACRHVEIVQSQMTKTNLLTALGGGDHVT